MFERTIKKIFITVLFVTGIAFALLPSNMNNTGYCGEYKNPVDANDIVPGSVILEITGEMVPRDIFLPYVVDAVEKNLELPPGMRYAINANNINSPDFVNRGEAKTAFVPVLLWGRGFRTESRYSIVSIINTAVETRTESVRHYVSNSPEQLTEPGTLLDGYIETSETVRYLAHHQNSTGRDINFIIVASNPGSEPARLQIIASSLEKDMREMPPGSRALHRFLNSYEYDFGRIIEIQPGEHETVHKFPLSPKEVLSGIGEMQLLSGERVEFKIKALDPMYSASAKVPHIGKYDSSRGHGEFGPPIVEIRDRFTIGGRWRFIGIGDTPLQSLRNANGTLPGNYGVTHRLEMMLVNPHKRREKVEMHFSPVSGPATGAVLVDGKLIKVDLCRPPDTVKVAVFKVDPGTERKVNVEIVPESGSFYPVRLIFKSRKIPLEIHTANREAPVHRKKSASAGRSPELQIAASETVD